MGQANWLTILRSNLQTLPASRYVRSYVYGLTSSAIDTTVTDGDECIATFV
jgi:hypothetical protein